MLCLSLLTRGLWIQQALKATTTTFASSSIEPTTVFQSNYASNKLKNENNIRESDNPTIFGKILRGELPARIQAESPTVVALADRRPRARLHHLVIPKQWVPTVYDLTAADLPLLREMRRVGLQLLEQQEPAAYRAGDYRLVFHVPPFNSVDHLHLHVLAPVSQQQPFHKYIKYHPETRWCVSWDQVTHRLEAGLPPIVYERANPFWTNLYRHHKP